MAKVTVRWAYEASLHEAETAWSDTSRWPEWVDGAARVLSVDPNWPQRGSSVVWQSGPAGRGRVRETVLAYEPGVEMTLAVEDDSIRGTQRVTWSAVGDRVVVEFSLEFRIKRRSPATPLIEWLFVRRPMTMSLTKTLERFGARLAMSRAPGLG